MAVYGCVGALVAAVVAVTVAVEITADLPPCRRESKWLAAAVVVAVTGAIRSACSGISASTVPSPVIASPSKGA